MYFRTSRTRLFDVQLEDLAWTEFNSDSSDVSIVFVVEDDTTFKEI